MKTIIRGALLISALSFLISCDKDGDGPSIKPYTVPVTYTFSNVKYEEATARVKMLDNINKYLGTTQANMDKVPLDQTKLDNMWTNSGNAFDTTWLNSTGVSLSEIASDAPRFKTYIDGLVALSKEDLTPAADGTAGYIARNAGKILVSDKGLEYVQGVQKGTMGAAFFKEGIELLDQVTSSNNTNIVEGEGTEMAHTFDLAYGYFSLPTNYDTTGAFATANKSSLLFWGNYIRERGLYINANDIIWKAFRTGRAAIEANDITAVNKQVSVIKEYWEKVAAAAAWAYTTIPQGQTGNLASQLHALSEGFGFIAALKYRPSTSPLTASQYDQILEVMGPDADFYELISDPEFAKLKSVKEILKTAYGQLQPE